MARELESAVLHMGPRHLWQAAYAPPKHPVIAIIGGYKTGKSTWFNHLAGREVAATDVLPCTDRLGSYFFELDPEERRWRFLDGPLEPGDGPPDRSSATGVLVEIVDTPGIGSLEEAHRWDPTELRRCHVVVMVHTAVQGVRADERELLQRLLLEKASRIYLLFTRSDEIDDPAAAPELLGSVVQRGVLEAGGIAGICVSGRYGDEFRLHGDRLDEKLADEVLLGYESNRTRLAMFHLDQLAKSWDEAWDRHLANLNDTLQTSRTEHKRFGNTLELVHERLSMTPDYLGCQARVETVEAAVRVADRIERSRRKEQPEAGSVSVEPRKDEQRGERGATTELLVEAGRALLDGRIRTLRSAVANDQSAPVALADLLGQLDTEALRDAIHQQFVGHFRTLQRFVEDKTGPVGTHDPDTAVDQWAAEATSIWLEIAEQTARDGTVAPEAPRSDLAACFGRAEKLFNGRCRSMGYASGLVSELGQLTDKSREATRDAERAIAEARERRTAFEEELTRIKAEVGSPNRAGGTD